MTAFGPEGSVKPRNKRNVGQSLPTINQNQLNNDSSDQNPVRQNESDNIIIENVTDCALLLKNECPFGLSGKKGGICQYRHRQRCSKYMKWGDKHLRGCKDKNCQKLHPELCVRSLALECYDKNCAAKLHTRKCKRHISKSTSSWHPDRSRNANSSSSNNTAHLSRNNRWPRQDSRDHVNFGRHQRHGSQPSHQAERQQNRPQIWQEQVEDSNFPNMTVQPQLEAILQTIFKQQQELTRSAMREVVSQFGAGGSRGGCHIHSSC